jgi:hypothetical protein
MEQAPSSEINYECLTFSKKMHTMLASTFSALYTSGSQPVIRIPLRVRDEPVAENAKKKGLE